MTGGAGPSATASGGGGMRVRGEVAGGWVVGVGVVVVGGVLL